MMQQRDVHSSPSRAAKLSHQIELATAPSSPSRTCSRQSYFSMTTRTTSPCVHAPTCPLSQPHHSMPMHSNPRTTMMEVASQHSDECLLVSLSFTDILGLLGAESRIPIIIRDVKRREAWEEVLVEEEEVM
ncbi:uncharacterized protein LOC125536923 isoform X2 [Triticum urartu]|uniref:uncharacterized protein LOC125536923 isoform X2 n=1 Tax=Triticum urartu TaxID=4572 RepID=UPI0020440DF9|nr:uncharacterized protein LOC125536923 isoform X2 [Triticum urartu]